MSKFPRTSLVFTTWGILFALVVSAAGQEDMHVPVGLKKPRVPKDNPITKEKIHLGKLLYFDKRLSKDNKVSCASCHDPSKGWSNGEAFATGIDGQVGGRNTPTIINAAYQSFQFWDGRAWQLEAQALAPIANPIEMGLPLDELEEKLGKIQGYQKLFHAAFGEGPTPENVAKAIAAFERTILSGDAPYDHYKAGDETVLSDAAKRGMKTFFNKGSCSACHSGSNFSDGAFHNIGVGYDKSDPDVGRVEITQMEGDKGSFRTPTLREIARTAPYMHDGSMKTLEEVIDHYDKGGITNPQLDEEIFPLKLSPEEKADLITFLREGLSSNSYPEMKAPILPE